MNNSCLVSVVSKLTLLSLDTSITVVSKLSLRSSHIESLETLLTLEPIDTIVSSSSLEPVIAVESVVSSTTSLSTNIDKTN